MEKRSTVFARLLAALALAAAVVAVVVIVSAATSDDSHPGQRQHHSSQTKHEEGEGEGAKQRTKATTYTVKSGDTLIAIAHQTGLPVAEILALNPEVDPQILTVGQTLKLK